MAFQNYLADPRLVFEEAHTGGYCAVDFDNVEDAKGFRQRLSALKGLELRRRQDWCRLLFIRRTGTRVEVIDTDHPDVEKYMPPPKVIFADSGV